MNTAAISAFEKRCKNAAQIIDKWHNDNGEWPTAIDMIGHLGETLSTVNHAIGKMLRDGILEVMERENNHVPRRFRPTGRKAVKSRSTEAERITLLEKLTALGGEVSYTAWKRGDYKGK